MTLHFKIKDEKLVPLVTVKKIFSERKKGELTYEQKMAFENAKEFSKISEKDAEKLIEELKACDVVKLNENFIIKIVDVMPESIDDLKVIVQSSKVSFKKPELDKIFEIVKKYA